MESLNLNSQERELHQLQQMQDDAKESCMTSVQLLHSFLEVLSYDESKSRRLDKDEFQEDKSMAEFWVLNNQFQKFIDWQYFLDYDSEMTKKLFSEYTRIKVKQFRETLLLHMGNVQKSIVERTRHKRQYDRWMNERQMQSREIKVISSKALDASLVVTECSRTKSDGYITSSSSGTYITHVMDADTRPVNDQVPSAKVHLTAQHNVLANEQQHTDQSEPSYDTYLLEKSVENADFKAHIQEKVFANAALKNELRNLKENSVDTKFAKPSILGKPVLQPLRNQSVVRQPNATSLQNTTNGSKPNPRSNNQISRSLPVSKSSCGMSNGVSLVDHSRNSSSFSDSKHFVCSTCHKCVFNANHDNRITKFLKEVDSRAKVQSPKTRNKNKPIEPKSHTQKPGRQIAIGQRFSPKKSSAVHEKPNTPRSCLRWKPTGTGNMFTDNTTKVDSEPPNGLNGDITNPYECDQTLNVSAGPVPQSKERCMLQCALSLEEEKSSYL
ncbi:hypothetical protein Tco_1097529 [Tanacetum coccineum]